MTERFIWDNWSMGNLPLLATTTSTTTSSSTSNSTWTCVLYRTRS